MRPQVDLLPALEALQAPDDDGIPQRPIRQIVGYPGWLANGHVAIFVDEDRAARFDGSRPEAGPAFGLLLGKGREPAAEDGAWRIPSVPDEVVVRPKCPSCDGDGVEECDLGFDHDCRKCEGDGRIGKRGTIGRVGQRVYRAATRKEIIVSDRYAALLDGLTVVAIGVDEGDPICGIDEAGDIVVMVMPLRGSPEKVEAAK